MSFCEEINFIHGMEYLAIRQTADRWGISLEECKCYALKPGVMKIGFYWAIPADAEKLEDQSVKSGKYIKKNNNDKNVG